MKVDRSSVLECGADRAWAEVQTPSLLIHVMAPMIWIVPFDPPKFPDRWSEGSTHLFRTWAFGFIPLGIHRLIFETINSETREICTSESNSLVRVWNHRISISDVGTSSCVYRDEIEIAAGVLTLPVWLFAAAFYAHRQRRWRHLAPRL